MLRFLYGKDSNRTYSVKAVFKEVSREADSVALSISTLALVINASVASKIFRSKGRSLRQ